MLVLGENGIVQLDVVSVNTIFTSKHNTSHGTINRKEGSEGIHLVRNSSSTTAEISRRGLPIPRRIPSKSEEAMMMNLTRETERFRLRFRSCGWRQVQCCSVKRPEFYNYSSPQVWYTNDIFSFFTSFQLSFFSFFFLSVESSCLLPFVGRLIMSFYKNNQLLLGFVNMMDSYEANIEKISKDKVWIFLSCSSTD